MRIPGWFFFTIAVTGHLFLLLLAHFKGTALGFVAFPLPFSIIGIWLLHWPERPIEEIGTEALASDEHVVRECNAVRDSLAVLAEDSMIGSEVHQYIENWLRPRLNALAQALADRPELLYDVHVELQMALGDCQVRMERVWTAIADGASAEAHRSLLLAHASAISMCMLSARQRG